MEMGEDFVVAAAGVSVAAASTAQAAAPAAALSRTGAPPLPPTSLAPGFRFHPTDEELVRYYLRRKVCGKPFRFQAVAEIDVYKSEPWELADFSALKTRDMEWYFFSPVDKKYGNGSRLNRATGKGYWKATGKDRSVRHKNETIGMKKILVYYSGRTRTRTNWVMHEYRLCDPELQSARISQDAFVLCKIFEKSGLGPPNGDRYAPFLEEEWNEDDAIVIPDADDDVADGDEAPAPGGFIDPDQDTPSLSIAPPENPFEAPLVPYKRDSSGDPDPLASAQSKRARHDDPSCSRAVGSDDSTTTCRDPPSQIITKNSSSPRLEFPLLETLGPKESPPSNPPTFDSSALEKSVPPGYLKFVNNLENEILNVSMEKEALKVEVLRAQAMVNMLQSRNDALSKENDELKKRLEAIYAGPS